MLIRHLLFLALLLPAIGNADFHFQRDTKDLINEKDRQLASEIEAFLADYAAAYNNQDYRTVKSMWAADSAPVYMAEEVPFPLYGRKRLDNYFNPVPGRKILDGIYNQYSQVRARYVAPDVAVATYRLDYDIKLAGRPASHGWDRVMAVFVRRNDHWKLTAYAEAPMGPATMVRRMMKQHPAKTADEEADYATTLATIRHLTEAGVSPGFAAFLEERRDVDPTH